MDEAAFTAFHTRTARDLWGFVYRVAGSASDADDIVQEAFLRLLRAGPGEDDDERRRRFLFRVASNLVVDRWRKNARGDAAAGQTRGGTVPPADVGGDVARTFAELSPRERALLWLAYVEEDSHDDIAASLGVGRASVKVLLFRAKRRLRDLLTAKGLVARTS